MSAKTYIHGDVHNHVDSVARWLERVTPERVIWLGDWFDSFGDGPDQAESTAKFLAGLIETRENDVFIMGNHCVAYAYPKITGFQTWGWSPDKNYCASKWMTPDHWARFKIAHYECFGSLLHKVPVIASHAGFRRGFLPDIINENAINAISRGALSNCAKGEPDMYVRDVSGPLWTRSEPLITNYVQIFGHTPCAYPRVLRGFNSASVNFDSAHAFAGFINEYGIYQNSKLSGDNKQLVDFLDIAPAIN